MRDKIIHSTAALTETERKDLLRVTGKKTIQDALLDAVEYRIANAPNPAAGKVQ